MDWRGSVFPVVVLALSAPLAAQSSGEQLFEGKIRPVLAAKCYACHSSQLKSPMGGLILDTKAGLKNGGARGPVVVPGKPAESRMLQALRYTDLHLQMPPTGKLADSVIADFALWIAEGASDPREDTVAGTQARSPLRGMSIEEGRKWWSYQPVKEKTAPPVKNAAWPRTKIDSFILAKLEENRLPPSPPADKKTLITRASIDLTGLKPTYEEVEAFAKDTAGDAYERLVDRLLASPRYGERWGRNWLDVARYAEDFGEEPFAYAWRYRDWVIEALNQDIAYDRFVKLQLSADLMPGTTRQDWRALGYLGTSPVYHKDQRLSQEVLFTFAMDDWDGRLDAMSRGLLGMTVACARCHDHKFDPILTKDYYGLAGVFASTSIALRPLFEVDPKIETRFMWIDMRLWDLDQASRYLMDLPGSKPEESAEKVRRYMAEIQQLKSEMESLKERYPELAKQVARYGVNMPQKRVGNLPSRGENRDRQNPRASFMNAVYDAALYVDGSDPDLTLMNYRPGEPRDLPVMLHGSVATPGETAPRGFPTVLSNGDRTFRNGSGRLELGEKMFSDSAPLAARVIVNRVWGWHFGKHLVGTPSDFGTQGDKPSHPELLDDLAARFIANGWSLKWLHREIMHSAAYRQASRPRADGDKVDQVNRLLWRMNPRRLDIETFRDSMLKATGTLSDVMYGPSVDLDAAGNNRRTVYARISRQRLNTILQLYDFPDAMQTSPGRDLTTTPLQQLYVMNSAFIQEQAATLAKSVEKEPDAAAKVRSLHRRVLARDPSPSEIDLAMSYLAHGTLAEFAQVLLSTNEEIYWP